MPYGTGIVHLQYDNVAVRMHPPPLTARARNREGGQSDKQAGQPRYDASYLEQVVLENPFLALEKREGGGGGEKGQGKGGEEEDEEKGLFTASGNRIMANLSNPFATTNEDTSTIANPTEDEREKRLCGKKRDFQSRIVSYNPFAVDLPLLSDRVIEKNVEQQETRRDGEERHDVTNSSAEGLYIPSSPRATRAILLPETRSEETCRAKGEQHNAGQENLQHDCTLYYVPSSPCRL